MTDNEVMIALISTIESQLSLAGMTGFEVSRNQQTTSQFTGGSSDDSIKTRVFLFSISKSGEGRTRKYSDEGVFSRKDTQIKSRTIQVSVIHSFDESNVDSKTPEDIADLVHDLLDSPDAIQELRGYGVFFQNVSDIRPVFFSNDKDQNESVPNFDVLVNYSSSITKESGYVDTASGDLDGVATNGVSPRTA